MLTLIFHSSCAARRRRLALLVDLAQIGLAQESQSAVILLKPLHVLLQLLLRTVGECREDQQM